MQVVARDACAARASRAACARRRARAARRRRTGSARVCDASTCAQARGRPAVEHAAAVLAGVRARRRRASRRAASSSRSCSTTKSELPGALSCCKRAQQRLAVGRMQAGRRLVEHVDDAEQVASGSASPGAAAAVRRATASACCDRATGSRGRAPAACDALEQVVGDALRGDALFLRQVGRAAHVGRAACAEPPAATRRRVARARARLRVAASPRAARRSGRGDRLSTSATRSSGSCDSSPMSSPAKVTDSASRFSRLPWHAGHSAADHEARHALLHQRALRGREGVQHVACARR